MFISGRYVNIVTGESVTFQEAMANGDITVEFKSQRKIREEKSSYGIITIKTSKETRPYTILSVIDPKTEDEISTEAAYERGRLIKHLHFVFFFVKNVMFNFIINREIYFCNLVRLGVRLLYDNGHAVIGSVKYLIETL